MRNSIKLDGIAEAWLNHEPKTKAITADDLSKAIEWARVHIHINSDSLQAAIDRIYGDGFVLGKDMAMQEMTGVVLTDWDKWKPGNRAAAELVRRNNGLLSLINNSSQVISGLNTTTYNRLGRVLAETLAEGKSGRATAKRITEELGHIIDDPARALTIAVTETRRAVSTASAQAYAATGVKQVSWLIAEGEGLCDDCRGNNEESPIALGDTFSSGDYAPPAHPNCRCALQPNVDELMTQDEFEAAFANYDEEINLAIVPTLVKYDENQPRDDHGRFASDGGREVPSDRKCKAYLKFVENNNNFRNGTRDRESTLRWTYDHYGLNAKPTVSDEEFQRLKESGATIVYRGVSRDDETTAQEFTEQFRSGDVHFAGFGWDGNGTYTTTKLEEAQEYAMAYDETKESGAVMEMAIKPDATFIDTMELQDRIEDEIIGNPKYTAAQIEFLSDPANASIFFGYDGIVSHMTSRSFYIIHDRSAIVIPSKDMKWE